MAKSQPERSIPHFEGSYRWFQLMISLIMLFSLIEFQAPQPARAQEDYAWVAYNDCAEAYIENPNTTQVTLGTTTTGTPGELLRFSDGVGTNVTAQFTASEPLTAMINTGGLPGSSTDAYATFNEKVNMSGLIQFNENTQPENLVAWWIDLNLTNLDPNKTYTLAATANRNALGGSYYDTSVTRYSLSGDGGATNASTLGVNVIDDHSVSFNVALNNETGYVARWTGINPGADGTIVLRAEPHTTELRVYTFAAFMLAEETSSEPTNNPPILDPIGDKTVDEGVNLTFTGTATDDGLPSNTLTFSLINAPMGASIDPTSGVFNWTPTEEQGPGTYPIDVGVTDGELSDTETITVTVAEVNLNPILDPIGDKTVNKGETLSFIATAADPDLPAQSLLFSLAGSVPTGASITTDGSFTWTPTDEQSGFVHTFDVCVSDGSLADCETIQVTVVDASVTPPLPSSFYGEIHFMSCDGGPIIGDTLSAYLDDMTLPSGTTQVKQDPATSELVYAIDVSAYSDGTYPSTVTFKFIDRILASHGWVTGTNVPLHLHPPMANSGGPYTVLLDDGQVALIGSASDYGDDVSGYAWDFDNDGAYDDAFISDPPFTFNSEGVYPISLKVTDAQGGEGHDATDVIVALLSGLEGQVYDGNEHPVTVTGLGDTYTYEIFYDAGALSQTPPIDAGTYPLTVNILSGTETIGTLQSTLVIAPKPITVTADPKQKVYGDGDPVLTYTHPSESLVNDDSFTGTLSRDPGENIGDYAITLGSVNAGTNYDIDFVSAALTITPKPITVTASTAEKVYGQTDPILPYTAPEGSLEFDDTFSGTLGRTAGEDVGAYPINIGTLTAGNNYTISFVSANFTITPKPITVTADEKTKVYGDPDPELTYSVPDGALIGEDSVTGALTRDSGENVGVYIIDDAGLTAGANYTITFNTSTLTITARPITVTADNQVKTVSEEDPILTYTITDGGLVFEDQFTGELSREGGDTPGEYAILKGTLALSSNYTLTFIQGTFTILEDTKHTIALEPGWNLVSFNLHPFDTDIATVLSSIDGSYTLVYAWDATVSSGNWRKYDPAVLYSSNLTTLDETMGFWINMTTSGTLEVIGTSPTTTPIPLSPMGGGWNLVGYPSGTGSPVTEVFGEHLDLTTGGIDIIYTYHAHDYVDHWKLYDPAAPSYGSDLHQMDPGWGYWVYVTEAVLLDIAY